MVQFTNFIYSIVNTVAPFMTSTVLIYIFVFALVILICDMLFGGGSFFEWFCYIIIGLALAGLFVYILALFLSPIYEKEQDWRNWAKEHCKVIEKREGATTTGVGVSLKGQAGVFIGGEPDQTGYLCDDGVTYWKNE
ncbi:hypothetical protein [Klebsiella pneumoniae]|uniref:hypothetical protein n=1 Tax=Klebsiella pneumoniae TaxID=573 RepID=UPI00115A2A95|nr:hypothetical protein [Klebsiella pneumoniae]